MDSSNSQESLQDGTGVKVLLVDKDMNSLMYMSSTLEEHSYRVTTTNSVFVALSMILEMQIKFDMIMSEVDMPGMDGFDLLKQITPKADIPILLISATEDREVMRKALKEGACFLLYKPIEPFDLVRIWQHFFRYKVEKNKLEKGFNPTELEKYLFGLHGKGKSSFLGKMPFSSNTQEMGNNIGQSNFTYSSAPGYEKQNEEKQKEKTPRVCWTPELQRKFQQAYEALGQSKATPLRIKGLLGEPHLTTQHISSYLQKFRDRMKARKEEATKHGMNEAIANLVQNVRTNDFNIQAAEHSAKMANLSNFRAGTSEIVNNHSGQRNIAFGLTPLQPISARSVVKLEEVTKAPNTMNFQNNIGVGNFVPGLKPHVLQDLNGGLGMVADNFGASEGKANGMKGKNIMAQKMAIHYQFPDADSGKDASSPGGSGSACSVNQPSLPRIRITVKKEEGY